MDRSDPTLCDLLHSRRNAGDLVAFDGAGDRRWGDFTAQVAALGAVLGRADAARWLVYSDDAYAFAVALFAIATARGVAVLPPNGQAGTLARFAGDVGGCVLDEALHEAAGRGPVVAPLLQVAGAPVDLPRLERDQPFVEFLTSGSSGESKRVAKRLRHLDDEVVVLERQLGGDCDGARVYGTVSCQHIYGALFRVFWPLATGRPFSRRTYLHGTEVAPRLSASPSVLVTSPVQLDAMVESRDLQGVSPRAIVSSGAPLGGKTAAAVAAMTGTEVTEVFGSTETGGVACRQRAVDEDVAWQPHPEVGIEIDSSGALAVTSPFVSAGEDVGGGLQRFVMGDRVELDERGGFFLRGRVDRIVKIGGKRLSLPEMEGDISSNELVAEAAVVTMRRGRDARACAAVVLSEAGASLVQRRGRTHLTHTLQDDLSGLYDRVLLPRVWRFVAELPRNAQGKVTVVELQKLFGGEAGERPREPEIAAETISERAIKRHCRVPEDLVFFAGHFDSFPIVPGVVQVGWVVSALATLCGSAPRVEEIRALKLKTPLAPGDEFDLAVEVDEGGIARFSLRRGEIELSSGRIALSAE